MAWGKTIPYVSFDVLLVLQDSIESGIQKAPVKMQMDCPPGIMYQFINIYSQTTESLNLKKWDSKLLCSYVSMIQFTQA